MFWHDRIDSGASLDEQPASRTSIGLFGTLPILWRETDDVSDILAARAAPHWALQVMEEAGAVRPIDMLAPEGSQEPLAAIELLVMAQPRPLSPQENVALDEWVRRGGHVLLFADPMLTAHSAFPLGDKRRPQDTVLLSPILGRWGLRLEVDEDQPAGERLVESDSGQIPVNLPGRLVPERGAGDCKVDRAGLVARCGVGDGFVTVVADAAVLEDEPDPVRPAMLRALLHSSSSRD